MRSWRSKSANFASRRRRPSNGRTASHAHASQNLCITNLSRTTLSAPLRRVLELDAERVADPVDDEALVGVAQERDGARGPIRPQRPAAWAYASAESGRSKRYTWEHSGMSRPRAPRGAQRLLAVAQRAHRRRARSGASSESTGGAASSTTPASDSAIRASGRAPLMKTIAAAGRWRLSSTRSAASRFASVQTATPWRSCDGSARSRPLRRRRPRAAAAPRGTSGPARLCKVLALRDRRRHEERLPPGAAFELTAVIGAERREQVLSSARPRLGEARVHLVDDEEGRRRAAAARGSPSRPARRCRRRPAAAARAHGAGAWRSSRRAAPSRAAAPAPAASRRATRGTRASSRVGSSTSACTAARSRSAARSGSTYASVFPDPVSASMIASAPSSRLGVQLPGFGGAATRPAARAVSHSGRRSSYAQQRAGCARRARRVAAETRRR